MILIRKFVLSTFILILFEKNFLMASDKFNIAVLVAATGKYIKFIPPLISSAKKYFCRNHNVTYFIFTDGFLEESESIIKVYQKRLGWPHDSMLRCQMHYGISERLEKMDYVFTIDADMRFVDFVGDEILSD